MAHQAGAYPGIHGMKLLGVFLFPPGWDASPSQGYPQHFAGTHFIHPGERDTVGVKCLAQEHNTISPARTRTIRSGVEHTNHEATEPQCRLSILCRVLFAVLFHIRRTLRKRGFLANNRDVIRTSVTFCSYHILTSSVIYYKALDWRKRTRTSFPN